MSKVDLQILLNKEQKAKELGICKRTIDRRIERGQMSYITIRNSERKWFLPEDKKDLIETYGQL